MSEAKATSEGSGEGARALTLIIPVGLVPSLNEVYSADRWRRARIAKEAHEAVRGCVWEQFGTDIRPFYVPVSITIRARAVRPLDTDNLPKLIVDGIVYAGLLENDDYRHVPELHVYSSNIDKAHQRIEVTLTPIEW